MKITKYEHACFTVEKDGKLLIVDPGAHTHDLGSPENVVAIVVTHKHMDHFDPNALGALIAHNPDAVIFGPEAAVKELGDALPHKAVSAGDEITAGPFTLQFNGGKHAINIPSQPLDDNVGILIDERIYFPGDSFTRPDATVEVLALPAAAPWMKLYEAMDYLADVKPAIAFPTHDAILSDGGKILVDTMIGEAAKKTGIRYERLVEPLEI